LAAVAAFFAALLLTPTVRVTPAVRVTPRAGAPALRLGARAGVPRCGLMRALATMFATTTRRASRRARWSTAHRHGAARHVGSWRLQSVGADRPVGPRTAVFLAGDASSEIDRARSPPSARPAVFGPRPPSAKPTAAVCSFHLDRLDRPTAPRGGSSRGTTVASRGRPPPRSRTMIHSPFASPSTRGRRQAGRLDRIAHARCQ
jgi:hypothetical protein